MIIYIVGPLLGFFVSVGDQSPPDDKKDAHGFGKEICLLAQTESGAQVSRCET